MVKDEKAFKSTIFPSLQSEKIPMKTSNFCLEEKIIYSLLTYMENSFGSIK